MPKRLSKCGTPSHSPTAALWGRIERKNGKEKEMSKLVVTRVEKEEDRVLLYGHEKWSDYCIICKPDVDIKVGDTVEYEPYGYNFGWFKQKVESDD
jgi:hypothetical protein